MAIALPIPSISNDITTYDGLIAALQAWLQDSSFETTAPQLIFLAEAYLKREVRDQKREGTASLTGSASIVLPSDFAALRSAWLDTSPRQILLPTSPNVANEWYSSPGRPRHYQIIGDMMELSPAPDAAYTVNIVYERKFRNLFPDNQSNWLSEEHPDVYLWACLIQCEMFGWNDERVPLLKSALDEAIASVNAQAQRHKFGPGLAMRSPVAGFC
jgi:hypothetical protein